VEPPGVKRRAALVVAALVVAVAGCGGGRSLQTERQPDAAAVVQELPGLRISVAAEAWRGRPRSLPERVLPFLVAVRNTGTRPIAIGRNDFFLLDDAGRQYFPLPPGEVVTLLGGGGPGVAISPSIGIEGSTGGGGTIFGGGLGIALGGGAGSETRDVIPRALPQGPVQPGAELSGFLYFPRPTEGYRTLRVVAAPQDPPGTPRVEFLFRRVN
jgi:hypothetical protein